MGSGYTAPLSFQFFIKEIGNGQGGTGGTVETPVNPDAGDVHIPFNPMKASGFTMPTWTQIKEVLMGEIVESTFTPGSKEEGKQNISNAIYHAPFLLAKIFPKKDVGSWADDTNATIAMTAALADFVGTPETICNHIHIDDKDSSPNDIDVNLFGGRVEEYSWDFNNKDILRENASIIYNNVASGAIAYNSAPTFQNQRYAMWNDTWIKDSRVRGIPYTALTISTYAAMDASIKIVGGSFKIKMPRSSEKLMEYVNTDSRTYIDPSLELDVSVIDDEMFTEALAKFADRTDVTGKVKWTSGSFEEYLQCTKMKLEPDGIYDLPEVKDSPAMKKKLIFKPASDAVLSFAGKYDMSELPDPTTYL